MIEWFRIFAKYLFWGMTPALPIASSAIGQQCIVFAVVWFLPIEEPLKWASAVLLFSVVFHVGNLPLIGITALFGIMLYPLVFILGPEWVSVIAILHAAGGTALYRDGFDLIVWDIKSWMKKLSNL